MLKTIMSSSALALVIAAAPAAAQSASVETKAADIGIQDIIVTAQKRAEVGQKAPLAVTSLNAAALDAAHVNNAADLQRVVPDLQAEVGGGAGDPGGGNTLFSIRGLGASATGPQGSTGVASHFDGVYRQDGISGGEFFDLERIEVDPGPQGTLYGRSAAAGAINILPAKPELGHFGAAGSIGYGNYNALTTQGMLNVPIGDTLALRAAFNIQKHDGYYSNGYDDQDSKSARIQLLYKPTEQLSVRLYGSYTAIRGTGAGEVYLGNPATFALTGVGNDPNLRNDSVSQWCFQVTGSGPTSTATLGQYCHQQVNIDKYNAHAEIAYGFGGAVLTLVPAYTESAQNNYNIQAPLPFSGYQQVPFGNREFTFEGRLSDNGKSKLKWIVGANYYDNKVNNQVGQTISQFTGPNQFLIANSTLNDVGEQKSYAFFGQATYPVTDKVRLTLGGRYNHDSSTETEILANTSAIFYNFPSGTFNSFAGPPSNTGPQPGAISFNAFTYRVAVDADVGPHSIVYASVGSGYKPGGLNDGGPAGSDTPAQLAGTAGLYSFFTGTAITPAQIAALEPSQSFGPEKVTHFEIGTKNRFLNNTLQINDSVFYDNYSNYQNGQIETVNPLAAGTLGFVVTNAGKARVYGNELSVKWQPTKDDQLDVTLNYLNAKFTSFVASGYLGPVRPVPSISYAGYNLPNAATWSGNIGYHHSFDLRSSGMLVASAFSHITSGYWVYFAQAAGTYQSAYTSTTLDLTWASADKHLKVSAFVSNLENHDILTFGGGAGVGATEIGLAPPRTYGGSVSFKF